MPITVLYLFLFMLLAVDVSATTITFTGLPPGTLLGDQFQAQGVVFRPTSGGIVGEVETAGGITYANFSRRTGCDLCPPGMRADFSRQHREVKARVGLPTLSSTTTFVLTLLDVSGKAVGKGSVIVVPGTGFDNEVTAIAPNVDAVSAELTSEGDLALTPPLVESLTFDDQPSATPDFMVELPSGVMVTAGMPPLDVPITLRRLGGSTGNVNLIVTGAPTLLDAQVVPSAAGGTSAILRLSAKRDFVNQNAKLTVTGAPAIPAVGTISRSTTIEVYGRAPFEVSGPAMLDVSQCRPTSAATAESTFDFIVTRAPAYAGPLTIGVSDIATVNPTSLSFPSGALSAKFTLRVELTRGHPGSIIVLAIRGPSGFAQPVVLFPTGVCPREARNFVMRGHVACRAPNRVLNLVGAEVEIFRYVWWWQDDQVASTYTDDQGRYQVPVQADDVHEYYARVRLSTVGGQVYLEEAVNGQIWSQDSPKEKNTGAEIVANFDLKKEGNGVPECEIWTGMKSAYEEYLATVGEHPPNTIKVLLWKTIQVPYSFLGTINWPENFAPGHSSNDKFGRFRTSFHEFGHAVRHSLDGDWNHFLYDALAYTYAQFHDFCRHPIGIDPTGFAFNEGWAHFWSNVGVTCLGEEANFDLEGNVARDLLALAQCPGVGRKGMVSILRQGQNIIHSQDEFRERFQATFPTCPLPPRDGRGMPTSQPLSLPAPIEPAQLRAAIESDIATIDAARKSLDSQLNALLQAPCEGIRCNDRDLRAEVARARIATAQLGLSLLRQDLATMEHGQTLGDYIFGARDAWEIRAQRTRAAHRAIVLTALKRIEPLLTQRGDSAEAKRVAHQIQVIESGALHDPALLKLADVQNLQISDLDLQARVRTTKDRYEVGHMIRVSFDGMPGYPKDWVTVVPESSAPGAVGSWQYTDGQRTGELGILATSPGVYRTRAYENDGYSLLAESDPFAVEPSTARVWSDRSMFRTGDSIVARFSRLPGDAKDWIAIARDGEQTTPTTPPVAWLYTGGTQDGSVTFNVLLNPGTYRFRAFTYDHWTMVAETEPFQVNE